MLRRVLTTVVFAAAATVAAAAWARVAEVGGRTCIARPTGGRDGVVDLGMPARMQYDEENGYCGEMSLQTNMLKHGAWIGQEAARGAGGGELNGLNYERAMKFLKIKYDVFRGRGYRAFFEWAKLRMNEGKGVVAVTYFRGARSPYYDHIVPVVGYKGAPTGYSDDDVFLVNSLYDPVTQERRAGDFWCNRRNKKDSLRSGGCVPDNVFVGYAIPGPVYAGAGPRVELLVEGNREPGLRRSARMDARVRVSGLTPGRPYKLHSIIDDPRAVPATARAARRLRGGRTFTPEGTTHEIPVTFQSIKTAYFICVAA